MLYQLLFFIPFFLIFIFEGFGWPNGREIGLTTIFIWTVLLYGFQYLTKKNPLVLPRKITLIFLGFFILSAVSTFFSVNIEKSVTQQFYYLSAFLIFIYCYNNQATLRSKLIWFFLVLGLIFIAYSVFINHLLPGNWQFLIPQRGFQYVYAYYQTHNPLANLLLIPTAILLVFNPIKKKIISRVILILFIFFILVSFSRSSYLVLIIIMVLTRLIIKKQPNFSSYLLIVLLGVFFLLAQFSRQENYFKTISDFITKTVAKNIVLEGKGPLGNRNEYYRQAIQAIRQRPLFGFGPENFLFASKKNTQGKAGTAGTADNLFLEALVENGVLAGGVFILFIFTILKSSWLILDRKESVSTGLFVSLLSIILLFQIDSAQRYYSYFLCFFIISGVLYEEKDSLLINRYLYLIVSVFLVVFPLNQYLSNVYLKNNYYTLALIHFPINQKIYRPLIENLIGANQQKRAAKYLKLYERLFPGDDQALQDMAHFYHQLEDDDQARNFYLRALKANPANNLFLINEIHQIDLQLFGQKRAEDNLKNYLSKYYFEKKFDKSDNVKGKVSWLCFEIGDDLCQKAGINQPIFFYQIKKNNLEEDLPQTPYKARYLINQDGLNERYDYKIDKAKDVFRIMVLGGHQAFGVNIDTQKNWTELVEDRLNKEDSCPNIDRFDVINISVYGYDIEYASRQYQLKGRKYNPNLVLWWLTRDDFYQINDLVLPKAREYERELEKTKKLEQLREVGEYYFPWKMGFDEVKTLLGEETILRIQRQFFNDFKKIYPGQVVFIVSSNLGLGEKNLIGTNPTFSPKALEDNRNRFPKEGSLNIQGHREVANEVVDYLTTNNFFDCRQ